MKLCLRPDCARKGQLLQLEDFAVNNARADRRHLYCLDCSRRMAQAHRERLKVYKERNEAPKTVQRKPCTIMGKVKHVIEQGHRTRKEIQVATKLNEDQIGDALARLWFDRGELESRVVNGERQFFIRRAA